MASCDHGRAEARPLEAQKYHKKTTLEDLDIELAVLKEFVVLASDKDYCGPKCSPPLTLHQREVWSRFNDEIGKLMHDFSCTNPNDMNYEALAKRARFFKEDEKGIAAMCKIMEDMRNEAELKGVKKTAIRMIRAGKMPLEKRAD